LIPKTIMRFLQRPRLTSHIPPDFGVGVHGNEVGFVPRLVRSEEKPLRLEKNHGLHSITAQNSPISPVLVGQRSGNFYTDGFRCASHLIDFLNFRSGTPFATTPDQKAARPSTR
jgi:hypothetical protein